MRAILIFSLCFLFSCSKEKKYYKLINGDWKVTKVKIEDGEGFSHEDTLPIGELSFNSSSNMGVGKIDYQNSVFSGELLKDSLFIDSTNFLINAKNNRLFLIQNTDTIDFRIILLTPYDLQLEYYDYTNFKLKRFVFQKL